VSIGPAEIIIVLVIALLVFGPKRLPQMGKSLGKGVREFRKAAETAKTELGLDGVTDQINEVKATFTEPLQGITGTLDDLKSSVDLKSAIEAPVAATAVAEAAAAPADVPTTDGTAAGVVDEGPETPAITPQTAFADLPQTAPAEPEQPETALQTGFSDVPQAPEQPDAAEAPPAPESPDGVAAGSTTSPSAGA
jgi:TatA/E family protein of Tat protein translocase